MTEKMIEADKGGWYFLHRKAEVLREAGKYDEAAKLFESVIEKLAENDRLNNDDKDRFTDQCKYLLSSVYLDQGHLDKSVKVLEELVKRRPDTAGFANDLGYVLADHDQRLDEAQQLIEKALKLDTEAKKKALDEGRVSEDDVGENAAYLDSLAWVLFKKKEYAKALELMEKVIKDEESQHVEIYDHYAEVLLANGRKDDAIKAWEKALSFDEVTRRDGPRKEAVRKKLEKHTK
jgi:tetratricopeptide (TPR) repeat protein